MALPKIEPLSSEKNIFKSVRNIPDVKLINENGANVYDLFKFKMRSLIWLISIVFLSELMSTRLKFGLENWKFGLICPSPSDGSSSSSSDRIHIQ